MGNPRIRPSSSPARALPTRNRRSASIAPAPQSIETRITSGLPALDSAAIRRPSSSSPVPSRTLAARDCASSLTADWPNYRYEILGRFRLSITNRTFPLFGSALQIDQGRRDAKRLHPARSSSLSARPVAGSRRRVEPCRQSLWRHRTRLFPARTGPPSPRRRTQAQLDCDRASVLLKYEKLAQETNDVAVEALIKVRGASVDKRSARARRRFPRRPIFPLVCDATRRNRL